VPFWRECLPRRQEMAVALKLLMVMIHLA